MESFNLLDRECSALAGLFQITINEMKTCSPLWEEFLSRSSKLHTSLKGTLTATTAFIDSFQKIADHATNSRGGSTDVGATLTRLCLRHKEVTSRVRALTTAMIESAVQPLSGRLDEWKKITVMMDREHTKEYKKARSELKKKTDAVARLHKKTKKSNKPETNQLLAIRMEEVVSSYTQLVESERNALRKAMLEERARYCMLAKAVTPVLNEEVGLVGDLTQIQALLLELEKHTADTTRLPPATEQSLMNIKEPNAELGWQTPPSSPSLSLRSSHRSSMTSIVSSAPPPPCATQQLTAPDSGGDSLNVSPSHQYNRSRSASQSGGLFSSSSQDSGFTSQDALHRHTLSGPLMRKAMQTSRVSDISNLSQPSSVSSTDGAPSAPSGPSSLSWSATATATWPTQKTEERVAATVGAKALDGCDRPHTISTAYEKGKDRPALSANTFVQPAPASETRATEEEGGSSPTSSTSLHTATISRRSSRTSLMHYHQSASNSQESINSQCSSSSSVRSKPPLPSRGSSLERPSIPEKKLSCSFRHRLLHHGTQMHQAGKPPTTTTPPTDQTTSSSSGEGSCVPDFNQAPPDMIVPQPVYSNLSELTTMEESQPHASQPPVKKNSNQEEVPVVEKYIGTRMSYYDKNSPLPDVPECAASAPVVGPNYRFMYPQPMAPTGTKRSVTAPTTPTDNCQHNFLQHSASDYQLQLPVRPHQPRSQYSQAASCELTEANHQGHEAAYQPGVVVLRKHTSKGSRSGSLRRSIDRKPPTPPIRRTASISNSTVSLNDSSKQEMKHASSSSNLQECSSTPLQHATSSTSLKHSSIHLSKLVHSNSSSSLPHSPPLASSVATPQLSNGGHESSSSSNNGSVMTLSGVNASPESGGATPKGSMENLPPPPDFLLHDDSIISTSPPPPPAANEETKEPLSALQEEPSCVLSPEEFTKEIAKQLAPLYRQTNANINFCSHGSSQNSSPSSIDQLSPLIDDHPSPPSPCPPSPHLVPVSVPIENASEASPPTSEEETTPGEQNVSTSSYSEMFGPPRPIEDEGLSKRKISVSEAVRNLQQEKAVSNSSETLVSRKVSDASDKSKEPLSPKAPTITSAKVDPDSRIYDFGGIKLDQSPKNNSRADIPEVTRASPIKLNADKNSISPSRSPVIANHESSLKYDPYTQPLPMKLHQENMHEQIKHSQIRSPNENSQAYTAATNGSPNANTQQQLYLQQLQQQQQQLLLQQQKLKHHQNLKTNVDSKAFLATLNNTLSQRPVAPNSVSKSVSSPTSTKTTSVRLPVATVKSPGSTSVNRAFKTESPSVNSNNRAKSKRTIMMGTSSRSSSIPQPNGGTTTSNINRVTRNNSSSDKLKFRQIISKSSNNSSMKESAASALGVSPRGGKMTPKSSIDSEYFEPEPLVETVWIDKSKCDEEPLLESPLPELSENAQEHLFKVIIIGDPTVGKTSLVQRYVQDSFRRDYKGTVGVDFALKVLKWSHSDTIKLQLWDIAGQDRFSWMTRVYYKDAEGCIIMFDLSNRNSFLNCVRWKKDVEAKCCGVNGKPIPCVLLANKCDLGHREVDQLEIEEIYQEYQFEGWTETSVKDNLMVSDSVRFLVEAMMKGRDDGTETLHKNIKLRSEKTDGVKKGCC